MRSGSKRLITDNAEKEGAEARSPVLDGWRGISILLVLIGHMIPLGPKSLKLNVMVSAAGLSIFFFLSGFLVVSMLLRNGNLVTFAIRRSLRILPLAWLVLVVVMLVQRPTSEVWIANLLFYANIAPEYLLPHADHLWSLSVEVQFYVAIALLVAALGKRGLVVVPIACILVTAARVANGAGFSILTWFRVDEILAGGAVAVLLPLLRGAMFTQKWSSIARYALVFLFFLSCHPSLAWLHYARPYAAAALICSTMNSESGHLRTLLSSSSLSYLAKISYALYVIHPLTYAGWLGEGDVVVRYTKRIFSVLLTFCLAHVSSFHFEKFWNDLAHRITGVVEKRAIAQSPLRSQPL